MASISEYPELIKSVFLTQEINSAGIYAFRFFIRGKPWVVTIDDELLFDQDDNLVFSKQGPNNEVWGPLLEKAFAKVKGTYSHVNGGYAVSGLRMLIGSPVFHYAIEDESNLETWEQLKTYDDLKYIVTMGTESKNEIQLNSCGLSTNHAFSLVAVFPLKDLSGLTLHRMYLARNPQGISTYSGNWHANDTKWTPNFKAQVPFGIDPTADASIGFFAFEHNDLANCFADYQVAHYRDDEGYSDDWYD